MDDLVRGPELALVSTGTSVAPLTGGDPLAYAARL